MLKKHDATVETLAGVSLFAGCSQSELRELAGHHDRDRRRGG